ncbi:MAG: hypothetical protein Q4B64_02330 [Spirochaetales bacterium]|nr:hypothetical protein [Spirochaetales bacterium]
MKNKKAIQKQQADFIEEQKKQAKLFVSQIDKTKIETILLSGSVARGDFFPGEMGGMIDLVVMKNKESGITAEELFGPNQEPEIPFHCIKFGDCWFQILFIDFISADDFIKFDEARKFSFLESEILYDPDESYTKELVKINEIKKNECAQELQRKIGYINYLLSDYKKDRWLRRKAFLQLHENLNTAIRMGVVCLYYKNSSYAPAEDRQLYYSLTLEKLPASYEKIIHRLKNQNTNCGLNYKRREDLFRKTILAFVEDQEVGD